VNLTALATTEARRPRRVPVEVVHGPADGQPLEIAAAGNTDRSASRTAPLGGARFITEFPAGPVAGPADRTTLHPHEWSP
jgi:hypothetical protein